MGLRDKYRNKIDHNGFQPLDLSEGNVQTIFNRCLAKNDSKEITISRLYFGSLGHEKEDSGIIFDTKEILLNRKNIEYLYGQLKSVHMQSRKLSMQDFAKMYLNTDWTHDKAALMQLVYLGSSEKLSILSPFGAKNNDTTLLIDINPTLSPKDPNFPAWWEEHKSEWEEPEQPKRRLGGQEPSDD